MGRNLKFCSEAKVGETDTNWRLLRVAVQAHMVMRICLYGEPPSLVRMTQLGKVKRSSFELLFFCKLFFMLG